MVCLTPVRTFGALVFVAMLVIGWMFVAYGSNGESAVHALLGCGFLISVVLVINRVRTHGPSLGLHPDEVREEEVRKR